MKTISSFSIPVSQRSPEEENRLKIIEESRLAKETAKKAQRGIYQKESNF